MQNSHLCCFKHCHVQMFQKSKTTRTTNWLKSKRGFSWLFFKAVSLFCFSFFTFSCAGQERSLVHPEVYSKDQTTAENRDDPFKADDLILGKQMILEKYSVELEQMLCY